MAIRELCQGCYQPQANDDCTFDKERHLCSPCQTLKINCPFCDNWDVFHRQGHATCLKCESEMVIELHFGVVQCRKFRKGPKVADDAIVYKVPNQASYAYIHDEEPKAEPTPFNQCATCGKTIRTLKNPGDLLTVQCTECTDKAYLDISKQHDPVNHPKHYNDSPAKCCACRTRIECIDITRHMSFNLGNAVKYIWRYQLKNGLEDLKKALWYLQDAINSMERKQ